MKARHIFLQQNIYIQSAELNPENFTRRKNIIMLPALEVTYVLSPSHENRRYLMRVAAKTLDIKLKSRLQIHL